MRRRKGAWAASAIDPEVRVKWQVEAGIDAEVMNPTTMLGIMRNPDVPVLQACSEVFNDWLAEFVAYSPKRLIGISTIPMNDVDWAVERTAQDAEQGPKQPHDQLPGPRGLPAVP